MKSSDAKRKTSKKRSIHASFQPNEVGRVIVSPSKQAILPISCEHISMAREDEEYDMAGKKNRKNGSHDADGYGTMTDGQQDEKLTPSEKKAVDIIWKHMGLGHIDISYACVGYAVDGRPILCHDELVNLLINYGFTIKPILAFIEDFSSHAAKDKKSPIVMYTLNTSRIMTEIEPIV